MLCGRRAPVLWLSVGLTHVIAFVDRLIVLVLLCVAHVLVVGFVKSRVLGALIVYCMCRVAVIGNGETVNRIMCRLLVLNDVRE